MKSSPFRFLRSLATFPVLAGAIASANPSSESALGPSPDAALRLLLEGNQRFIQGLVRHPHQTVERRKETSASQAPFAVVLTCADSRLSPEIVFDQGLGDLFVIRNAGNLLSDHVLGSIEYAVEHLHSPLIVVMGHTRCGAVAAAVAGGEAGGHVQSIVNSLAPVVAVARARGGDTANQAEQINARMSADALVASDPVLAKAVSAGKLKVVAARYNLATGAVEVLP
jgi:carbonic anhydrase